jgi:GNAT superfamily N-acetyltransferase
VGIVTAPIETRRAGLDDLDAVMADLTSGFASYVSFAQPGWEVPDVVGSREGTAELLGDPDTWALLALIEAAPVGHVAFFPGRRRNAVEPGGNWRERDVVPGLAHLWQLFVLPDWWGRGVAPLLHDAAMAEMRARGYDTARLFTPSLHERARRFYERRGWMLFDEGFNEWLDLGMAEYRLTLRSAETRGDGGVGGQDLPSSQPSR